MAVLSLGVGALTLYPVLREQAITEVAIGTWSCTDGKPGSSSRTVVIGDGTFFTDAGVNGTWGLENGHLTIALADANDPELSGHLQLLGVPDTVTPTGRATSSSSDLVRGGTSSVQWSYEDGQVVLSAARGQLLDGRGGPMVEMGRCARIATPPT